MKPIPSLASAFVWLLILFLTGFCPLVPVAAATSAGDADSITLTVYTARLQRAVTQLEAAIKVVSAGRAYPRTSLKELQRQLPAALVVQTPSGPVRADLRKLSALLADTAAASEPDLTMLKESLQATRLHLDAAERAATAGPTDSEQARLTLQMALRQTELRQSLYERLAGWLSRLFGREGEASTTGFTDWADPYLKWGALLLGATGLAMLSYSLMRSLSPHTASEQVRFAGLQDDRSGRPPSPAELLTRARLLSEQGEHLEALRTAFHALMLHYDRLGLMRFIPALTLREQEAVLRRRHPDLARRLNALNSVVEERVYGGQAATAEDFVACEPLIDQLWREGDAASKSAKVTTGESSPAPSP